MSSLKERGVRALRWSEKYTRTDMVYLTKGGLWLLLGHIIQMGSGVIIAVAFANLVPKETYGAYQFIISMAVIISAFTLTGMGTAISRTVARGSEGALRTGLRTQLFWSIGMVLAGATLAVYYYLNENNVLALSFLIAGSFSPFLTGFGLAQSYFVGKRLFRESAIFGIWRKLIPVLSILTTILLTQNVVVIVLVYFASNTLASFLLYILVVRRYHLPKTEETEMVAYSKHLSLLKTISEITSQVDRVLVWVFLGAAPTAAYALAQLPITHLQNILKLSSSLTFPKLSITTFAEARETLPHKVMIFFLITVGIAVVYIFLAPPLFSILFPAYPESILLSQVLALTILSRARSLYGQVFTAHKMKREQYLITISTNGIKIVLLFVLLPLYGIWGAVYALLGTHVYDAVLVHYLFFRKRV